MKHMLKDKKIDLVKITLGQGDFGQPIEIEEPLPNGENIWAYYRHASGSEFFAAAQTNHKLEVVFIINWRDDLDPTDVKVRYKGELYDITRIDDFEGYKNDIKIYASKLV